jgi:outer membrane protein
MKHLALRIKIGERRLSIPITIRSNLPGESKLCTFRLSLTEMVRYDRLNLINMNECSEQRAAKNIPGCKARTVLPLLAALMFFSNAASAVTLDEAIRKAFDGSYLLKEQKEVMKRSEFSYLSTIDPYLPRADLSSSYIRSLTPGASVASFSTFTAVSPTTLVPSYDNYSFTGTLTYRVFDGGERYARRGQAYSLLEREKERFKGLRGDVLYSIRNAFYTALGKKAIVEKRGEALGITNRICGVTKGRYEEGVAKKSEVLQAEVRVTTAKIELFESVKDYEKAMEGVKSLLLYQFRDKEDVEGFLEEPTFTGDYEALIQRAVSIKPDVVAQQKEVDRLTMVYKERKSAWFPKIDASLSQTRQDTRFFPEGRTDAFIMNLTFPLFDGVGRYYNMKGALNDVSAAAYRLDETRRSVTLDIIQAFKDYELSEGNMGMLKELVREATINFDQAFGEYKVGKGDILTVLQTERDLAKAKENYITAVYQANTALANLQRAAYIGVD